MTLFEDTFEELEVRIPNEVIQEATKNFANATQGLASLNIIDIQPLERLNSKLPKFAYRVLLLSDYLRGYSCKIFDFGFDVTLYPVSIEVESQFADYSSISGSSCGGITVGINSFLDINFLCENEDGLLYMINHIFSTAAFKKTVGGIMKIAKIEKEKKFINTDMPWG